MVKQKILILGRRKCNNLNILTSFCKILICYYRNYEPINNLFWDYNYLFAKTALLSQILILKKPTMINVSDRNAYVNCKTCYTTLIILSV